MCGAGHFGMRGVILVETQAEFDRWLAGKKPQYAAAQATVSPGPLPTTEAAKADTAKPASGVKTTVGTTPNTNL